MKKVRKGAIQDDSSNVVDVFGGTGQSQEELLAAALGEDLSASASDNSEDEPQMDAKAVKKNKKKAKKKSLKVDAGDENAVDVFGGSNLSQEELLAQALGTNDSDSTAGETQQPAQSQKKKKGKKAKLEQDNTVDVFASPDIDPNQLLADALGDNEPQQPVAKSKKKKGKKGKGGSVIDTADENAVDIFGSTDMSQEDLLADALGTSASNGNIAADEGPAAEKGKKKKKKGKKGAQKEEFSFDQEPVFRADAEQEQSPEAQVVEEVEEPVIVAEETDDGADEKDDFDLVVEDDFEPEQDVVEEFEKSSEEFTEFTSEGRRQKLRSKRRDRNAAEDTRLGDLKRANFGSGGEKYSSVRLEDVTVTFRAKPVLNGVTWGVHTGERVGLIGENGCGKTTQLRLIAGTLDPTSGDVVRSSAKTKASFLRQEFVDELDPTRTLREEFLSAFQEESELLAAYSQCEKDLTSAGDDMEKMEQCLNRMEDIRIKCEEKDAWNLNSKVDKVMPGLGFTEDDNDKLVASFSGGWKVRIGLGKVLMQDPDLLLLDEPSNHLDTESVEWLEEYLQTCKLPMVVVSHDREFLDKVCTKIVEIESGEAFEYPGNYTTFVKLKKEQRRSWEAAYERQQKFLKEQTIFIKRNKRNPARSSQVKSRQKMLERMERTGQIVRRPPRQGKPLVFRFPPAPRSGRDCILVEGLTHGYGGRTLFEDASIGIERGDRIALIGPNGAGKTTLLRLITGREEPQEGSVECESLTNISLAYYEQNQADALDLDINVLDTLKRAAPVEMAYEEIRALLGKFLFKGDDVEKMVGALSGGEKARLALAKIMLTPSNVLILDEPGNHLSISAKEMLEEALQNFDGTLLLVSHDRYLISQVATQIVAVEDRELILYDGDYKSYMEKNAELKKRLQSRFIPGVSEIKNAPKIVASEPMEMLEKKTKRKKNFGGSGVQSGKTKEMNAKRWNKR